MKKIGLICLAVVLAVGVGGLAYATWSQELIITETVNTGEVEVGVRDVGTNDNNEGSDEVPNANPINNNDPGWKNGAPCVYDKNVAHTESVNGEPKFTKVIGGVSTQFYHDVSDTIYSGYPCYAPLIVWEITNNGSIPVKLELSFNVDEGLTNPWALDPFVNIADWKVFKNSVQVGHGSYLLYDMLAFLEGYQLEPCDTLRLEMIKHIWQEFDVDGSGSIDQPFEICPMNATVTYTMTVNAVQWNLYTAPSPPPG